MSLIQFSDLTINENYQHDIQEFFNLFIEKLHNYQYIDPVVIIDFLYIFIIEENMDEKMKNISVFKSSLSRLVSPKDYKDRVTVLFKKLKKFEPQLFELEKFSQELLNSCKVNVIKSNFELALLKFYNLWEKLLNNLLKILENEF
ncbi:MAG: hypothetical protein ACFFD2_15385 [Promethearchaeota archaeon]